MSCRLGSPFYAVWAVDNTAIPCWYTPQVNAYLLIESTPAAVTSAIGWLATEQESYVKPLKRKNPNQDCSLLAKGLARKKDLARPSVGEVNGSTLRPMMGVYESDEGAR